MQTPRRSLGHARSKPSDRGWLRVISFSGAALAVAASIGASNAAEPRARPQPVKLSFTAHTATDNPVTVWAMGFAKSVAQKSKNTLLIDVHANSELVSQDGAYAALTSDKINMGALGLPQLPLTPELVGLQYINDPFVTPTWEEAIAVAQSAEIRKIFNDELKPLGLRLLGMCAQGYTSFLSQTPIRTMADFKGLRVRVSSSESSGLLRALGAEPVSIALGGTYKALQEKTVTVAKTNIGNFYSLKWYQFAKYLDFIPINQAILPIVISLKSYNGLSKAQQKILESVAVSSMLSCHKAAWANEAEYIRRMEQEGVTVIKPDSLEPFEKAAAPDVAENKATLVGTKIARVIDGIHKRASRK